jgi:hypothetical protein
MPNKYKTKDGIIDVSDYSFSELSEFTVKYPNAELLEEDFQNGTVGTGAPVVPETNQAPEDGGSSSVDTSLEPPKTRRYLEYKQNGRVVNLFEDDYLEKYAGKRVNNYTYPDTFEDYAKTRKGFKIKTEDFSIGEPLEEVVIEAKLPEAQIEGRKKAEELENTIAAITPETEKSEILSKYFLLDDLKPRNHASGYVSPYGGGSTRQFTFKSDEDYNKYLKENLGNKYDKYVLAQEAASKNNETLNKDNIANYASLDDADGATINAVVSTKRKSEAQVFMRDIDPAQKGIMQTYTGVEEVQEKKKLAAAEEVARAEKDATDFEAKFGRPLVRTETIQGRTYRPYDVEKAYAEIEREQQIKIGKDIENYLKDQDITVQDQKELTRIEDEIKKYEVPDYQFNTQEEVDKRDNLVTDYNTLVNKINSQIVILKSQADKITDEYAKTEIASTADAALLKSYATLDKLDVVMEESFLGTSAMLGGFLLQPFDNGESYNAAINYNQRLQNYKNKYLPDNLTMDDSSSAGQYLADMLVNNAPSIAVALGTMGTGSIAAGGGAVAKAVAQRQAARVATGVFFTMEAGGQLSNLEIAQREADEILSTLKSELADAEKRGAGLIEINAIKKQIEDQEDIKSLAMWQKGLNSFAYGGIAAAAERFGTLSFIKNFQRYSKVGGSTFRKAFGDKIGNVVAKNVGLAKATGIGVGIENLEETLTLGWQNAADNLVFNPSNPKSLIEGLDGEFFRNTAVTSLAISGPNVSQSIYSQIASSVKTRKQAREEGAIRDELVGIQNQLGSMDKRSKAARELKNKRDALITKAAILNTEIPLNLKDLSGAEIEQVFENVAEISRLKNEAAELDITDLGATGRAEYERLKNKAQELFNANQSLLGRSDAEIEKMAKTTANPVEAEFNLRRYRMFTYIAQNNPNNTTISINNEQQAIEYAERNFKTEAEQKAFLEGDYAGGTTAYFDSKNNNIVLFKENALNTILQGGIEAEIASVSPLHEIGHQQVIDGGIIRDDALVTESANDLVKSIIADVQLRFDQGKISQEAFNNFNDRVNLYKNKKYTETEGVDADELLQLVGDFTAIGILPRSSYNNLYGAKRFINSVLQKFNSKHAPMFGINKPSDVYAFIANYQNKASEFRLRKGIAGEGVNKASISAAAKKSNDRVDSITKDKLNSPASQAILYDEIANMAAAQIANRYSLPPQTLKDFVDDVVFRIYNAGENTKWDGRGKLSGFLGGRISLRISDVVAAEYKKPQQERQYLSTVENLQPEDQKGLVEEVQETQVAEKPKYKNLLESKVLSKEAANNVKNKIVSITRVLKSKIDAAVSLNKTVTPLIAEIKKEIGKQADIEFKKMLGNKKGGELKRNYLKLKKPILENMTTTWLMQAMPFAIQKQVDGKFTSNWQGKKIDRETVETDKAGRTSGAEIVRRLPNAAEKISDEVFLSYLFDGDEVIRGRKEALAKSMAEEYAFDVYNEELQNPESEIRKAFENNQERLGVELADNFIQEFSRQSERGNVKRSIPLFRQMLDLEIQGDLDGSAAIFETLSETEKQFWLDATADLRTDNVRYKQALKKLQLDIPKNVSNILELYFKNPSARDNAQAMKEYYNFSMAMIKALPNDIVKALGHDFFGAHYRYMNPAIAKSYGAKIKAAIDALPAADSDITLIQAGFGLVQKITTDVLHKEFKTTQEKVDYFLENYGEQVQALNIANKNAIEKVVSTAFDLAVKKPQYAVGLLRMLESTTNIGKSLRGLTGISDIQMTAASQAVYINKKTGQGYTNTAKKTKAKQIESGEVVINTKHPNYKEAQQAIKDGSKQTIDQLLRIKGEHATPSSNFNVSIGTEFLTALSQALQNPGGLELIKNSLISKISELSTEFNQQLNTKVLSDIQDSKLGSTSDIGDLRLLAIPIESQNAFFDIQGRQTIGRVNRLIKNMFSAKNISEAAEIQTQQKALNNARKASYPLNPKGISVYDFDDTLAFSKSQVIVNKDGKTYKITPAEFAKQGETLANEGAKFDFSEFNKVVKGTPGPLAPRLKKAIEKFGNKNIFVLTARPAESANAIHTFLKGIGLEIPLENITGLANGAPAAKAAWMIGKVAEGYNDFYFVDDHLGNVKAVKDVLNVFDVKGKVQQARIKRSKTLSNELNEMIERNKGVRKETTYSKIKARKEGARKGKFKFFLPYGAEDFRGLTSYTLAGKGKQGEADQKWFEDNLIRPYLRGINAMEVAKRALKNDFTKLLNSFPGMKKRLGKKIGDTDYTVDQAIRVYLWTQQGQEIPDISKRDQKKLNSLVSKDAELKALAQGLQAISKKDQWVAPTEYWIAGSILKDVNDIGEKVNRAEYLQEFNENIDIVFDEKNLNKLEAIYGTRYVDALKNSIARMKSGRNRPAAPGKYEQQWLNWVNNSVGTIMFFNRRSAAMQMLSFANFVNWGDNNPLKAGIAFANQPAYWSAWSKIFNSPKLKERRGGLKSDVQEQEIASQAKNSKDKASAVIAYLLKIGFTPTQLADSFAIATGGATFLINRTKTYKKQGFSEAEAEAKAFEDFSAISDETQQSGDPMLISAQQSSHLGRLVLAFQNTPMQYTRLMKKAAQDIANGRGDFKTNMSKILYYGFIQNLIFSSLQNALFALIPGFDEEEEDDEKYEKIINTKTERIVNSMVDTILRGSGLTGAVISTLKNTINRYYKEEKKGFTADHAYTLLELANVSPPIGSKLRKVYGAIQTKKFDRDVMSAQGYDVTLDGRFNISPNYEIIGSLASAGLNLPLDRALAEVDAIAEMLDARNTSYQRLALGLGWRTWDVNAKKEEEELAKMAGRMQRSIEGKKKAAETRKQKQKEKLDKLAKMTPEEKAAYMAKERRKRSEAARKAAITRRENKRVKDSILRSN